MSLPIPAAALTQHAIVLGKTRSGKSSKMRVLVEHLLDKNQPVCILDPKGDWFGLRLPGIEKKPGYEIVIFGGEHADVQINARSGAAIAELVATGNRPTLIDLGGWTVGDRTRFFIDFASAFFKTTKGTRHLVIDEVHNFAPKGKIMSPEAGMMLHWANRIASEGQGKGIILLAASQRPQKVHNDFLTSCETLIACRVTHKADRDADKDWMDGCADPSIGSAMLGELASMDRADAWVWSPEINFGPKRVKWPLFKTFDSFKPRGGADVKLKGWASVDLGEIQTKLADIIEEGKANDPAELKRQIADLKKQLSWRAIPVVPPVQKPATTVVIHDKRLDEFERSMKAWLTTMPKVPPREPLVAGKYIDVSNVKQPPAGAPRKEWLPKSADSSLPSGETKILTALIQYPKGLSRSQITVITGFKRSTRDAYIFRLKEKGLVGTTGDTVHASEAGRAALPSTDPLPTGAHLREYWYDRLPAGEAKILRELVNAYPDAMTRENLTEATGFKRSTRDAYIHRLLSKEIIVTGIGGVGASETLF